MADKALRGHGLGSKSLAEWECPRCGQMARRSDGVEPEPKEVKPPRTHWDMLRERRSIEELEDILAERLEEIRKDT